MKKKGKQVCIEKDCTYLPEQKIVEMKTKKTFLKVFCFESNLRNFWFQIVCFLLPYYYYDYYDCSGCYLKRLYLML